MVVAVVGRGSGIEVVSGVRRSFKLPCPLLYVRQVPQQA